jgi:hypothetical protein
VARKQFTINKEPHVAVIGDDLELQFLPEVMGDEFLEKYGAMQDAYKDLGVDLNNMTGLDVDTLRGAVRILREFLAGLMLPESVPDFEAARLPDRVLIQLMEWAVELYGGGGQRPPTSSTGSVPASPPPGSRGRAVSRSKASTSTRGR